MVFQSYALYPHMTVRQNITLPLAMRNMTRLERLPLLARLLPSARRKAAAHAEKVRATAAALEIESLLDRKPSALSGGQKQRVALGRALVRDPVAFLLDEPLSNLDAKLRLQMRGELVDLHRHTGRTFVYVTHDQAEAMSMSDRIAVMIDGRIVQEGTPRDLYQRPQRRSVAAFVGDHPINMLAAEVTESGRLSAPFAEFALQARDLPRQVIIGIRAEALSFDGAGALCGGGKPGRVSRRIDHRDGTAGRSRCGSGRAALARPPARSPAPRWRSISTRVTPTSSTRGRACGSPRHWSARARPEQPGEAIAARLALGADRSYAGRPGDGRHAGVDLWPGVDGCGAVVYRLSVRRPQSAVDRPRQLRRVVQRQNRPSGGSQHLDLCRAGNADIHAAGARCRARHPFAEPLESGRCRGFAHGLLSAGGRHAGGDGHGLADPVAPQPRFYQPATGQRRTARAVLAVRPRAGALYAGRDRRLGNRRL